MQMDVGAIRSSSDDIQTTNGDQPQKYGAMLSRSISAIAIRYKGHQFLHVDYCFPNGDEGVSSQAFLIWLGYCARKGQPTTGFSGTNDSKYILPLSISQCDLPQQRSTNAAVMHCLLRPENSVA